MDRTAIKLGLMGLGTVGTGVVRLLQSNRRSIEEKLGRRLRLVAVADRGIGRGERIDIQNIPDVHLTSDPRQIVTDPEVDVVIELIGGTHPANDLVLEAIAQGKDVVTANKALLALYGEEIFTAAEERGVSVGFEASVAGGIPIIRTLREGLAADRNLAIYGIVNGTCNYILTTMSDEGKDFAEVLGEAQEKGLAEADPSFDIDGIDAAHKLTLLTTLAFSVRVPFSAIYTEGVRRISQTDIFFAREFGYTIKLLAIAKETDRGIEARVHPTMIPRRSLLADVGGAYNAIYVRGEALGSSLYFGQGAGMLPTATAVLSDVIEVARNRSLEVGLRIPPLGCPWERLQRVPVRSMNELMSEYYLRFMAVDRPGVLAKISGILGAHEISIASVIQKGHSQEEKTVPLVLRTHEAREQALKQALKEIDRLSVVEGESVFIRIEENLG
jgi:homoserine dehydrogenase